MQEVNLKKFIVFSLFYLTFLFQAPSLHRKFQLQDLWICALAWWCQKNHFTSHTHTHTPYLLNTSLTTFLFTPLVIHVRHRHELRKTYICSSIPTCLIIFSMFLWGIENLYVAFPNSVKERVTKTGLFQLLSKNA
jgi:Na+/melibiose symporter-like transporter